MDDLLEKLDALTADMDIPEKRRHDISWLLRNLGIRNREHENFNEAYRIVLIIAKRIKE